MGKNLEQSTLSKPEKITPQKGSRSSKKPSVVRDEKLHSP